MSSTLTKSSPQAAYCVKIESYQACPAAVLPMTPYMFWSHGQVSDELPACLAVYVEPAIAVFALNVARGMPRIRWTPNFRPIA